LIKVFIFNQSKYMVALVARITLVMR